MCVCGAMKAMVYVCVCVWSNEGSSVCGAMRAVVCVWSNEGSGVCVEQ